jgi:adenosylmethionine---8-amino-7-oxononanoate aminotransferase
MQTALQQRDLNTIWHPCSQMKDYENYAPLEISSASGPYLHLANRKKLIDGISSWWCKSLGHAHPRLKAAMIEQSEKMEHAILANTTNETIVTCSEAILNLSPAHDKVFYASDGSCAVEIALKMAVHAQQLRGQSSRTGLLALRNGYHGETALTLSVSDIGIYKAPYACLLQTVPYIDPLVTTLGPSDPNWSQPIPEESWQNILKQLEPYADSAAAFILEPIVQGAGGMVMYHPDVLRRLRCYTREHGIFLIADEIMTGIGRTGKMLACEHAGIHADFVCLSKGLTGGYLPFSAVMIPQHVYELFYDDHNSGKAFLHSHTYTGHALGARVTTEALKIMEEESVCERSTANGELMQQLMKNIADETELLGPVRQIGSVVAAELIGKANFPRAGYQLAQTAAKKGALVRPLGNTLYWTPPLNCDSETLHELHCITKESVKSLTA